jgi:hypothetical protein
MTVHKWLFASNFRYHGFSGSDKPIPSIKEALSEIRQIWKSQPELAAAGAVLFLEKISPAIELVDSSSTSLGRAVHSAIQTLLPIIIKAKVEQRVRDRWLERLWEAIQVDQMPYIESLGEHWGELCVSRESAAAWAEHFLPLVESMWAEQTYPLGHFCGTFACLSSLYAAGQHQELLNLLDNAPYHCWRYRRWGVKSLICIGKKAAAIRFANQTKENNSVAAEIARTCEEIMLSSGLYAEAYSRYAIVANQNTTHLATFRAIVKKYPQITPANILADLIADQPGSEGQWFSAAKDAGLFELAIELVGQSPADPRTLSRAAKDFALNRPEFAISAGLLSLLWISRGYGYRITAGEVREVYTALVQAGSHAGVTEGQIKTRINDLLAANKNRDGFVDSILNPLFLTQAPNKT